jgi:DNA-binding response OmpR family regulator
MNWQATATPPVPTETYTLNNRTIDLAALEITTPEKAVRLTLMEAELLRYLLDRPNQIISRKEILEAVWRVHTDTDTRAIDNFIVRLRRYLETDPTKPAHLLSVRGVGYRFVPTPDTP